MLRAWLPVSAAVRKRWKNDAPVESYVLERYWDSCHALSTVASNDTTEIEPTVCGQQLLGPRNKTKPAPIGWLSWECSHSGGKGLPADVMFHVPFFLPTAVHVPDLSPLPYLQLLKTLGLQH